MSPNGRPFAVAKTAGTPARNWVKSAEVGKGLRARSIRDETRRPCSGGCARAGGRPRSAEGQDRILASRRGFVATNLKACWRSGSAQPAGRFRAFPKTIRIRRLSVADFTWEDSGSPIHPVIVVCGEWHGWRWVKRITAAFGRGTQSLYFPLRRIGTCPLTCALSCAGSHGGEQVF